MQYQDQSQGSLPANSFVSSKWGNARQKRDPKAFEALCDSVQKHGINQPITVRPNADGELEIVAGYGRVEAALKLDVLVPFIVREISDEQAYEIHISENLDREDLHLVDQIKAAQYYSTHYRGDRDEIAQRWGKTRKRIDELLELAKCCHEVLDALREKEITVKMAIILAPFSHTIQKDALGKIISEGWTLQVLQERANRISYKLESAKFDKKDCIGCEYNTTDQFGLFENTETNAKCTNSKCFREKTVEWLEVKKATIEEQFGKTIFLTEIDTNQVNTVSAEKLGEQTFENNCVGCENKVVVMNDKLANAGAVVENQCISAKCFKELLAQQTTEAIQAPENAGSNQGKAKTQAPKPKGKAKNTKKVLANKLVEQNQDILKDIAINRFQKDPHYQAALIITCMTTLVDYKVDGANNFAQLLTLFANDAKLRSEATLGALEHFFTKATTLRGGTNVRDELIRTLALLEEPSELLVAWKPTKEILSSYTVEELKVIAKQSNLSASVDKDTFTKEMKKSKKHIVEFMLKHEKAFEDFYPQDLEQVLKSKGK